MRGELLEPRCVLNVAPVAAQDEYRVLHDRTLIVGDPSIGPETTLIAAGSTWRYLDNGTNQGMAWSTTAFNDSTWSSGPAELGYGEGDEATVINAGIGATAYVTSYYRREFTVDDPASITALTLGLLRDDGGIIYLNGVEVARDNMFSATSSMSILPARSFVEDNDRFYSFPIDPRLLAPGRNVLAVEIHQGLREPVTGDASFDARLTASTTLPSLASAGLLQNDNDADGDALHAVLMQQPGRGDLTLRGDGSFIYRPLPGFIGTDTFYYRAFDGQAYSSSWSVVTIRVRTDTVPDATPDHYQMLAGTTLVADAATRRYGSLYEGPPPEGFGSALGDDIRVSEFGAGGSRFYVSTETTIHRVGANAQRVFPRDSAFYAALVALTGPDDYPDSADLSTPDVLGSTLLTSPETISLVYAPFAMRLSPGWYALVVGSGILGASGITVFGGETVTLNSAVAQHSFRIFGTSAPTISGRWAPAQYDYSLYVDSYGGRASSVLANDSDVDGDPLSARLVSPPMVGALDFHPDGTFTYAPPIDFAGPVTFTYLVDDGDFDSLPTTVTIDVRASSPPLASAVADVYVTGEDAPLEVSVAAGVLANDPGSHGNPTIAHLVAPPKHGALTLQANGAFRFVPAADFTGSDVFLYRVGDGTSFSGPAAVTITVTPSADPPGADVDYYRLEPTAGSTGHRIGYGSAAATYVYGSFMLYDFGRVHLQTLQVEHLPDQQIYAPGRIAVDPRRDRIYYSYLDRLYRVRSSGSGPIELVFPGGAAGNCPNFCSVKAIEIDSAREKLYWVARDNNAATRRMWRSELDGSNPEQLFTTNLALVAIDAVAQRVYLFDAAQQVLQTVSLTGTNPTTVLQFAGTAPNLRGDNMYLDPVARTIYWIDTTDSQNYRLMRGSLENGLIAPVPLPMTFPVGMAIDYVRRKLYISSSDNNNGLLFWRTNMDGTAPELVTTPPQEPLFPELVLDQLRGENDTFGVLANDRDPDGDVLAVQLVTGPGHGSVTLNADGSFTYQPAAGFQGRDQFTYAVTDGTLTSAPATVYLDIGTPLPGDANFDGRVERHDVLTVLANLGRSENVAWPQGDFDDDRRVTTADLAIVQQHLTPPSAPGPSDAAAAPSTASDTNAASSARRVVLNTTAARRSEVVATSARPVGVKLTAARRLAPRRVDAVLASLEE